MIKSISYVIFLLFSCTSLFSAEILYFPSVHSSADKSPMSTHGQQDQKAIYDRIKEIVASGRNIKIVAEELYYAPGYKGFYIPLFKPVDNGARYQLSMPKGVGKTMVKMEKQPIFETLNNILKKYGAISALLAESFPIDDAHPVAHNYIKDLVQSVSDEGPAMVAENIFNSVKSQADKLYNDFFKQPSDVIKRRLKEYGISYNLIGNDIQLNSFSKNTLWDILKKTLFANEDALYNYIKAMEYDREAEVVHVLAKSIKENPDALHILIFGGAHNFSKYFKDKPNVHFSIAEGFQQIVKPESSTFAPNEAFDRRFMQTFVNPF